MTYSITKTWRFSAAHALDHLPVDHKCHSNHGHNYRVEVALSTTTLDAAGFVVDYGVLSRDLGAWIDETFDHKDLNDVLAGPSTAEHLAKVIFDHTASFDWASLVDSVTVSETDGTSATYAPIR
jgi:6-pyruvoyltetrahydropterin/6-carboxytetrahydropterin synthase